MSISRLIMGFIFIIGGIFFTVLSIFTAWWLLFYGVPLIIIGIILFLNKHEDKIEQRQDLNKTKSKK